jgi:hypothetical protein
LAEIDILLPKLAVEMGAEDCIVLNLRAFKISFILMDVVCVLAQLAGTALTITFGDLVNIGQKVSSVVATMADISASHRRTLGPACILPLDRRRIWDFRV